MIGPRTVVAGLLLLTLAGGAHAQSPPAAPRIGFLSASGVERERPLLAAFQQALRELGYTEARTVVIEARYAGGQFQTLPDLAAELVRRKVDVLVVAGAPAAHAAKNATTSIPIVMTNAADPVGTGLVASLGRPGGNLTGLSDFNAGVVTKRLEILKEVAPAAARIAILFNPTNPTHPVQLQLTRAAAPTLGASLIALEASRPQEIERAFALLRAERADALMTIGDPMFGTHRKKIVDLVSGQRVPAMFTTREYPLAGGLIAYGTNFEALYRRAATYVDRVLKGANPGDLPVEQPSTFELVVNLRTARALGLTIPPSILLRADHIIEP
jgi:putative ABC transport system substrate-binding protein